MTRPPLKIVGRPTGSKRISLPSHTLELPLPPPSSQCCCRRPMSLAALHMGHMLEHTEIDILTRWHRMCGDRALWIPGTGPRRHSHPVDGRAAARRGTQDSPTAGTRSLYRAGLAVEAALRGRHSRPDATPGHQCRLVACLLHHGCTALRRACARPLSGSYEQGLIYRGAYIVNWCPRCQTAISDLEVVHEEQKGHLWEIRYPHRG